jgi:hypothetical protein
VVGLAACGELLGPNARTISLTIVPVFDAAGAYAAAATTADSLRIIVLKGGGDAVPDTVAKETAVIDSLGQVNTTIEIPLLQSPSTFRVVLQALRSSDGVIVFAGENTVVVTSQSAGPSVTVPIVYTGPKAKTIVLAPKDTAVASGAVFTYRVTAYDSLGGVVAGVESRFFLVNKADSTRLILNRLTGLATAVSGATGAVQVYARTVDSAAYDTARVFLGSVPAAVRTNPGYANLAVGDTLTFTGQVVDGAGNVVPATSVSWVSRSTGIATVNAASGKATAVAPGTAVLVAGGSGFSDSVLVTVPTATYAVVSTTSSGRAFRVARVGDTVVVDVTADLRFTPSEKLGSYNATLTWTPATLQFLDVQTGGFAAPTVNSGSASSGQLRFSAADPTGASGAVVVARVRLRALAAGTTATALSVTEMSATSPTFTNLFAANRVTVTNGSVTVRP